jgi:hypothetical protein
MEPTVLTACAYRGCGGWGYYYYNLTRAIISLYRGATPGITVLALSGPTTTVNASIRTIDLRWAYLGKEPSSFAIELDGKVVAPALTGSGYKLNLSEVKPGSHHVRLTAAGVYTHFSMDPSHATHQSTEKLPVQSEISFDYGGSDSAK